MGEVAAAGVVHDGVLVEWYRYEPGPAVRLPTHAHEEYQLNLTFDVPGGVRYRGGYHVQPASTLSVIMPEEAHTPVDPDGRDTVSRHLTLYLHPDVVRDAAHQLAGKRMGLPTFRDLVVGDAELVRRFARLGAALTGRSSKLEQEVRLLGLVTDLLHRHAKGWRVGPEPGSAGHQAVRRARDYLHDNVATTVSLAELARVSRLSPFHLARLFTASLGMPPHAYQIQLRVALAKRLLLTGTPVAVTAHRAGFFDLSHLTRHFKRHVGVPPGAYATPPPLW
ncbi:AraC family transcriptional regulator [Actinomycetes bacterium KLBMP 9797]